MRDTPQRPPRLDGFQQSREDLLTNSGSLEDIYGSTPASPPYRTVASSSNINIHTTLESSHYPPSPAYASTPRVDMLDEKSDEKAGLDTGDIVEHPRDVKRQPTVHYHDDVNMAPAPVYHVRNDSGDMLSSRSVAGTDDEDDPDDYDWSGEDDLVDQEAKFEERMGVKGKRKGFGFKRIITLLFSTLIGSTFIAGVLVTPGVLIHYFWYKPNPTAHRFYVKENVQAWLFWAAANVVISWYLAMIVDIIPVVTRFMISLSWGHVSEYVKSRIEMYDTVKNTIKPLLYVSSGWASWVIIFGHIFNLYDTVDTSQSRAQYTNRVAQAAEFLFFLGLVLCAQQMLSHAIAFAFRQTAYKDRIELVQEALTAIEKLREYRPKSTAPRVKSGMRTPVFGKSPFSEKEMSNYFDSRQGSASPPVPRLSRHQLTVDDGEDADSEGDVTIIGTSNSKKSMLNGKGKGKDGSPLISEDYHHDTDSPGGGLSDAEMGAHSRPMTPSGLNPHRYPPSPRQSVDGHHDEETTIIQAAKVLKTAILHDARNIGGTSEGFGSMAWNVNSAHEAKRLARSIYTRFKDRRRTYLLPSDFYPAFPSHEAAEAAFRVFDKDNNGDISRAEIKTTLLKVYKERRFLSRSMRDVGAALNTLDHILLLFAFIILFFISLSVFGVEVGDSLTSVYSIGIAASFIFKNTASSAFDAIMFIFVTHPYDTGDRCFIDDEVLVVKKVGLFATVFTRSDGNETYYFNSQLFSKFITNVRRSGKMFESLTIHVAWRTPLEKLDTLEKHINEWLSTEENRWFQPSTSLTLQHIRFQRYLEITIGIPHNGTWQDWGLRSQRKTAFCAAVQFYCRQLDITCFESPLPIVYGDPENQTFMPSTPISPGDEDDLMIDQRPQEADFVIDADANSKSMKPLLGFLPPVGTRSAQLTRARKSKSKKAMLRGMDG